MGIVDVSAVRGGHVGDYPGTAEVAFRGVDGREWGKPMMKERTGAWSRWFH
jgi:hypothetical protein